MKNSAKYVSLVAAAALAGVALFAMANSSFSRFLPIDVVVAASVTLSILAFAVRDYARVLPPLIVAAPILRPALRANRRSQITVSHKQRLAA